LFSAAEIISCQAQAMVEASIWTPSFPKMVIVDSVLMIGSVFFRSNAQQVETKVNESFQKRNESKAENRMKKY